MNPCCYAIFALSNVRAQRASAAAAAEAEGELRPEADEAGKEGLPSGRPSSGGGEAGEPDGAFLKLLLQVLRGALPSHPARLAARQPLAARSTQASQALAAERPRRGARGRCCAAS